MKNQFNSLSINSGLFISGFVMIFSGLLIQLVYHVGGHGKSEIEAAVAGFDYTDWTVIHKTSILVFSLFMVYHSIIHRKWYKSVIARNLVMRNKLTITLTVIFLLVAISGFLSWLIDLGSGDSLLRKTIMETHDKIALLMVVLLIVHVYGRLKWFKKAFKNIRNEKNCYKQQKGTV